MGDLYAYDFVHMRLLLIRDGMVRGMLFDEDEMRNYLIRPWRWVHGPVPPWAAQPSAPQDREEG
jgi:hypothetical protein